MTLSVFNPRLLNFLSAIAQLDGPRSPVDISRTLKLEDGSKVSSRTINRWFKYLNEPFVYKNYRTERKMSYFPHFFKNRLGFNIVTVFYDNPSKSLLGLFPMRSLSIYLYDTHSDRSVLAIEYVIPRGHHREFLSLLPRIVEDGYCSRARPLTTGSTYRMTSPWHKVVDRNGVFHAESNDEHDIETEVEKLRRHLLLNEPLKVEMSPHIGRNPFVIPVLAEYMFESRSSIQVWKAIRTKLGERTRDYAHGEHVQDSMGIKMVQHTLKTLTSLDIFNQMRLVYFPLEIVNNVAVWTIADFKDCQHLLKTAESVLAHSLWVNVYPITDRKALFGYLTSGENLGNLFHIFEDAHIERQFVCDMQRSADIIYTTRYSIFDYPRIFNPQTCSWRYDQNDLLSDLEAHSTK